MKVASASAPLYSFQGLNLAYEGKPTVQGYEQAVNDNLSDYMRNVFTGAFK